MPNVKYQIGCFDLLKRMLASVADDDLSRPWADYPCLEWPRGKSPNGYGRVYADGKSHRVHRLALALTAGPIADNLNACHHCDNPPCFRPIHLFSGTQQANIDDCRSKDRMEKVRGEKQWQAKLTDEQVLEIRRLYLDGATQTALARGFGIEQSRVSAIVLGNGWAHLPFTRIVGRRPQRGIRGESNAIAKLTEDQVLEIRRLHSTGKTQAALGVSFSVSRSLIGKIVGRQAWTHI